MKMYRLGVRESQRVGDEKGPEKSQPHQWIEGFPGLKTGVMGPTPLEPLDSFQQIFADLSP